MENTTDHIDELIGKYLAGEASDSERAAVDQWVQSSEQNLRYFRNLEIIFTRAAESGTGQQFDTDAAWNALREKLSVSVTAQQESSPLRRSAWYWKAAASIALIVSVGYLVYHMRPARQIEMAVQTDLISREDTLPDGSVAFLNRSSSLNYAYNPRERTRKLILKGEAYFDVNHIEETPFQIECAEVIIEDIGTTFNVSAYPDAPTIEVFVETGEVAFYTQEDSGLRLKAGEMGVYDRQTRTFTKRVSPDRNVLAYKTRTFVFPDSDLASVVGNLNEVYETRIILGNEKLSSCRLSVTFRDEPIEAIAEIIGETLGLGVVIGESEIILEGTGCEE